MSSSSYKEDAVPQTKQGRGKRTVIVGAATAAATMDGGDQSIASAPAEIHITYEEGEEGETSSSVPLSGSSSRRRPRQRKPVVKTAKSVNDQDDNNNDDDSPPNVSFQDQLAASALSGTIEFLKVAGGLTLNATGKVVAPPLHVTRTVLLPALWAATVDYIHSRTPKRVKDWFRILSSSVYHVINVLKETEKGKLFRQRLLVLGGDILDCLSADTTRQLLIDGMASVVKFTEALHTPECKAFLDQYTVLCCRLTQVAASGRSQQALHDAARLVWSGVEVLADPQSTTALAEVTAYLCHALEMEDAILDGAYGESVPTNAAATKQHTAQQKRAERRKEREEYQKQTFQDKTTLMTTPNATVEQVILSSLGTNDNMDIPGCDESNDNAVSLSSSHVDDGQSETFTTTESKVFTSDAGSIRKQVEDASQPATDDEWHERAQRNVNVPFLRDQISKRANRRKERGEGIPLAIPVVSTVADEPPSSNAPSISGNAPNATTNLLPQEADDENDVPSPLEGEDALERFYRVLDSVIQEKRKEGLDHLLAEYSDSTEKVVREGHVRKFNPSRDAEEQPHHVLVDTIRSRLATIRADVNKGLDKNDREKLKRMETVVQRNSKVVYLVLAAIIGLVVLWIGFGIYGICKFVSPTVVPSTTMPPLSQPVLSPVISNGSPAAAAEHEIVIRLVREVVHVDQKGFVLDRSPDQTQLSRDRVEKIAACMSDVVLQEESTSSS